MHSLRKKQQFILDTEKGPALFGDGLLRDLDMSNLPGTEIFYFADFYTTPGPGIIEIQGQAKYAEFLAEKQLRDSGELSEDLQLQLLFTEKKDKATCKVGYSTQPREKIQALFTLHNKSASGLLLYDVSAAAYEIYTRMIPQGPLALVLQLPQGLILAAGDDKKPSLIRRYALTGEDEIFLPDAVAAMENDLYFLEQDNGINLQTVHWLQGLAPFDTQHTDIPWERETRFFPVQKFKWKEQSYYSALGNILPRLKMKSSLNPKVERRIYPLMGLEPWMWLIFFLVGAVMAASSFYLQSSMTSLARSENRLEDKQEKLAGELSEKIKLGQKEISGLQINEKKINELAAQLRQAHYSPRITTIWNELAAIKPEKIYLRAWESTFSSQGLKLRLEGDIFMNPDQSQRVFTNFLHNLEKAGYTIQNKTLNLNMQNNQFTVAAEKKIKTK